MTTLSFLVKGMATEQSAPVAWVTVEERNNGSLFFKVKQMGGAMGNLHGLYFDITDEALLNTLTVKAISMTHGICENLTAGMRNGTDPVQSFAAKPIPFADAEGNTQEYSFTLQSRKRALVLSDFSCMQLDYSTHPNNGTTIENNDDDSHRWLYLALL